MPQPVSKPHVVFSTEAMAYVDAEGHTHYKDVIIATITPQGGTDNLVKNAEEWLKELRNKSMTRSGFDDASIFYAEWYDHFSKAFEYHKKGLEGPLNGTDLKLFKTFTPAELKNCAASNIFTVEELANCNEQFIQRVGMGGRVMKNKAQAILDGQQGVMVAEENAALKLKVDELSSQVSDLIDQLKTLVPKKPRIAEVA